MEIIKRAKAPTPRFFKKLRAIGLILAAVGGTVLAAPVTLPAVIVAAGGYVALAGGIISAISQITVDDSKTEDYD